MQYIYEENSQYASVRLDRQAAFKSSTLWCVRAGKGLIITIIIIIIIIIITIIII